jgi:hypothetical protein
MTRLGFEPSETARSIPSSASTRPAEADRMRPQSTRCACPCVHAKIPRSRRRTVGYAPRRVDTLAL